MRLAEIDLLPGTVFVLRVEAPLPVLDAVTCAGGILLDSHGRLGRTQLVLAGPVHLDLLSGDHRGGSAAGDPEQSDPYGDLESDPP